MAAHARGTSGRFLPGSSGNPRGRPPTGLALAEAIRERVAPEKIIERALRVLDSDDDRDAMAAATFLAERGWIKPPQQLELDAAIHAAQPVAFDLDALDADEKRAVLAALRKARGALAEPTVEPALEGASAIPTDA